jgi:hypothetical protein
MAHRISTRISLRWLPDPPSEPTDTLVFNVGDYFMDLRVLKADASIDWGMAGERQILSKDPLKCRWIKTIDSLGPSEPDEGTFTPLPNGDDLETGSMPCAEKENAVTDYEEVWRKLVPRSGPKRGWILQSVEGKTFLGRVGGGYLALSDEQGHKFGARSEEWSPEKGWRVKYAIGDVEGVPSFAGAGSELLGEAAWKIGETVVAFGKDFVVRAFEDID